MNKYRQGIIYKGNLMIYINGESAIIKENEFLVYSEEDNSFYTLMDILNPSLDLLRSNLEDEQKENVKNIIEGHKYPYINNYREGNLYIDENTIVIAIDKEENKIRK